MESTPMKQWTGDKVKPQFSDHLRHASKQTHSISDALVNTRLIAILIDRKLYARALGCFYLIFETLENKLSLIQSSGVEPRMDAFYEASLPVFRHAMIAHDLEFYLGPTWKEDINIHSKPYVQFYLDHIEDIAKTTPILLCAHSYTQHLAILSGGQLLKRVVAKGLQLRPDDDKYSAAAVSSPPSSSQGTMAFYIDLNGTRGEGSGSNTYTDNKENKNIQTIATLKRSLKAALDGPLYDSMTEEEHQLFISEAYTNFGVHMCRQHPHIVSTLAVGVLAVMIWRYYHS